MIEPFNLAKRIPPHMRAMVRDGAPPAYRISKPDYDRLPIDTFLVETVMGTEGRVPMSLLRVVKPNQPRSYKAIHLTAGGRLLYRCWGMNQQTGQCFALKMLVEPRGNVFRHVVLPDDPRHDLLAAFKMACDARRAMSNGIVGMKPDILLRALGVEPMAWPPDVGFNAHTDPVVATLA